MGSLSAAGHACEPTILAAAAAAAFAGYAAPAARRGPIALPTFLAIILASPGIDAQGMGGNGCGGKFGHCVDQNCAELNCGWGKCSGKPIEKCTCDPGISGQGWPITKGEWCSIKQTQTSTTATTVTTKRLCDQNTYYKPASGKVGDSCIQCPKNSEMTASFHQKEDCVCKTGLSGYPNCVQTTTTYTKTTTTATKKRTQNISVETRKQVAFSYSRK